MMRNFKRFLTLALAVVMLASTFAFGTSAAKFTDVDENNEYLTKAVNLLSYVGVTKGTSDTEFGTDELVTREQMAAFIYRLMKKGNSVEGGDNASAFVDLEDPTFFFMISWANSQGIIKGTSATTFEPKGSITLQDAYTMIVRALGYEKEEVLSYPFSYIEVAEDKKVALNEGLDSSVSYTDALTRGDVAILLYNAFFAETGVPETVQKEREIGSGENATWVLESVTEYPTFCEKYFDVIEAEYQAIATPNYVFGDADETTAELGYDAIEFKYVGEDRIETLGVPEQFYAAFEDLGVDGDADDYIMSHFTMYVILDDDDAIEEILYAEPLMTKKAVSDLKLETLTSTAKDSYYEGSDYEVKRLSGKVLIDGVAAYFYGAPYSYAKPTYPTGSNDAEKYAARNEKNLKFIDFALLGDAEDGEYKYTIDDSVVFVNDDDEYYTNDSVTLIEKLFTAYVGGMYEAEVYDVDGDGIYDYINYMPYSAYFVNTDDDYTFADDGKEDDNTVYTNEAVLAGEKFDDEDYVIGYFNQDANYIKVAAVIEPIEGSITNIKKATGVITLNGETKVSVRDGWKALSNFGVDAKDFKNDGYDFSNYEWDEFDNLLKAGAYDADDAKFYVYNDVLLFQEGIDTKVTFDSNLIVITPDEDGVVIETGAFSASTGKTTYVHAWVDGTAKYVPIDTDADVWALDGNGDAVELADDLKENGEVSIFVNKAATYSVDGNGLYTIKLLGNAYDDDACTEDDYIGMDDIDDVDFTDDKDDDIQAFVDLTAEGGLYFTKFSTRFLLKDSDGDNVLGNIQFILDKNTKVLIKNTYTSGSKEKVNYIELGASDLTESIESKLENVQVVIANNTDHKSREYLVLLFATVAGEKLDFASTATKKNERIVKMMDVDVNEDGDYYAVYDLFNPYTGATETDVAGINTSSDKSYVSKFTYGDVVTLESGKVADESGDSKLGNITSTGSYMWVTDYNSADDSIEAIAYPDNVTGGTDKENSAEMDDKVDAAETYRIDVSNASVVIIGHQGSSGTDMVRWGSLKVADVAKLDGSDKSYLAVNKNYSSKDGASLKTVYAKYVKVYMDIDWEDDDDHSEVDDDDFNGEAKYIVVIANTGENLSHCDL